MRDELEFEQALEAIVNGASLRSCGLPKSTIQNRASRDAVFAGKLAAAMQTRRLGSVAGAGTSTDSGPVTYQELIDILIAKARGGETRAVEILLREIPKHDPRARAEAVAGSALASGDRARARAPARARGTASVIERIWPEDYWPVYWSADERSHWDSEWLKDPQSRQTCYESDVHQRTVPSGEELLEEALEDAAAAGVDGERIQAILGELDANSDDPFAMIIATVRLRNLARGGTSYQVPRDRLG